METLISGPVLTIGLIVALGAFFFMFLDLYQTVRGSDAHGGAFRPSRRPAAAGEKYSAGARAEDFASAHAPPPTGRMSLQFSRTLETRVDRATGLPAGAAVGGPYRGRGLETLSRAECLNLFEFCGRKDPEAARLLGAYLRWRFGPDFDAKPRGPRPIVEGALTRASAFEVLGLASGAARGEIVAAHRALIKKHHPDHGGSTARAALINQAKDLLLAHADS